MSVEEAEEANDGGSTDGESGPVHTGPGTELDARLDDIDRKPLLIMERLDQR